MRDHSISKLVVRQIKDQNRNYKRKKKQDANMHGPKLYIVVKYQQI